MKGVHRSWIGFGSYISLMSWNFLLLRALFSLGNKKKNVGCHVVRRVRWVADHHHAAIQQEAHNYYGRVGRALWKGTSCLSKLASCVKTASVTFPVPVHKIHCFFFMHKSYVDHTMFYRSDQHLFDPYLLQMVMMFPTPCYDTQDCVETFKPCLQ